MKKLLAILICLAVPCLFAVLGGGAAAEGALEEASDFIFDVHEDGTVSIFNYSGDAEILEIPGEYNGMPVTAIEQYALSETQSLVEVTIPSSITSIGWAAFRGCERLERVNLSEGLRVIGGAAFEKCSALVYADIPAGVTTIKKDAFYECVNLAHIDIPESVTTIGQFAFARTGLEYVAIPDSVTEIGEYVFAHCVKLAHIDIPEGVAAIGESAFADTGLEYVAIPDSVTEIGVYAFFDIKGVLGVSPDSYARQYCERFRLRYVLQAGETDPSGAAYLYIERDDGAVAFAYYSGQEASLTIPSTLDGKAVKSISDGAFLYNETLSRIILPDSVTEIEGNPFRGSAALAEIQVSESHPTLKVVDGVLFDRGGDRLICYPCKRAGEEYAIPSGTRTIGSGAFRNLTAAASPLRRVVIPESVTYIEDYAFADTEGLTTIEALGDATNIGTDAFQGTGARLLLREDAETLRSYIWRQHISFAIRRDDPEVGQEVPSGDFTYCIRADGTASIIRYVGDVATLALPETLDGRAVTRIETGAFMDHKELDEITLPASVREICVDAFFGCGLARFDIPDTVTTLEGNPFAACDSLREITISPSHPTLEFVDGVLFSKPDRRLVCYPTYREGETYTVPEGTEIIGDSAFWMESGNALARIVIPEGVTTLGSKAIRRYFDNPKHITVSLPSSLQHIAGDGIEYYDVTCEVDPGSPAMYAFIGGDCMVRTADGLKPLYADAEPSQSNGFTYRKLYDGTVEILSIDEAGGTLTIPAKLGGKRVSVVGPGAIVMFTDTDTVRFPDNGLVVCRSAFYNSSIRRVVVPDSVRFAGNPFTMPDKLEEIVVSPTHPTLEVIDGVLFDKQTRALIFYSRALPMEDYIIPAGTTVIEGNAFDFETEDPGSSVSLSTVVIPEGVTAIGPYAFPFDVGISSIVVPDSVTDIDARAFYATRATVEVGTDSRALIHCADYGIPFTVRSGESVDEYWQDATVVKCKEWISLRESPSTKAEKLVEIPLGAKVSVVATHGEFYKCRYDGMTGYALAEYLSLYDRDTDD